VQHKTLKVMAESDIAAVSFTYLMDRLLFT
jgi:hypothetical protein